MAKDLDMSKIAPKKNSAPNFDVPFRKWSWFPSTSYPSNEDLLDCLTNHGAYHCTIQARHDESQGKACLTSVGHDHRDRHHSTKAVAHHGSLQPHPAKEKAENHGQSASKYEEFVRWIASWARNLR